MELWQRTPGADPQVGHRMERGLSFGLAARSITETQYPRPSRHVWSLLNYLFLETPARHDERDANFSRDKLLSGRERGTGCLEEDRLIATGGIRLEPRHSPKRAVA